MNKIFEGLTDQQRKVVESIHGKYACNSCAGSGKTKSIVSRTAYMLQQGIPANQILMFTFTRKAADEMKQRVEKIVGIQANQLTVCTYHSFCVKLLRQYGHIMGFNRNFVIYDEDDKHGVMKGLIENIQKSTDPYISLESFKDAAHMISYWKGQMISPQQAIASNEYPSLARFYQEYQQKMRNIDAFDFDDLQYEAIRLLETQRAVRAEVQNTYRYVTADEFQDSGIIDFRFIELLLPEDDTKWNFMCVLDDLQSIYSFRRADVAGVIQFINRHKLTMTVLGRNFRSTKTIVNASDGMVRHNKIRIDKEVFTENEQGDPITYITVQTEDKEAAQVARLILACKRAGFNYKDIAVLYRLNSQSRLVEQKLLDNQIPYRIVGGNAFYNRMEVKDLIAYIRFVMNHRDQEAFKRIANIPKRGIGSVTLQKVIKYMEDEQVSALYACGKINAVGRVKQGLENFIAVIEDLENSKEIYEENPKYTVADLIERVITLTDYREYIRSEAKNEEEIAQRNSNIDELIKIATNFRSVDDFSDLVMTYSKDESEEESDRVNLMTIHGSKGLEWPVVIIIGCNEGTLPSFMAIKEGNIEEERRICYVAMTRAKTHLFMLRANYVMTRNYTPMLAKESRFMREIDEQYLKRR